MKNLKQMIKDFQSEAKNRIAKGDFEVIRASLKDSNGYIGEIDIIIDDVCFSFSIHGSLKYVCEHHSNSINPLYKEVKVLSDYFKEHTKYNREDEIQRLQNKILELQK